MFNKFIFLISLIFIFSSCKSNNLNFLQGETIVEEPENGGGNNVQAPGIELFSTNSYVEYSNESFDGYLVSGHIFNSISKDKAIIIEKNSSTGNYDINLYENIQNKWSNANYKIKSYPFLVTITKSKNSDSFLITKIGETDFIDIFNANDFSYNRIELSSSAYPFRIKYSDDGENIFYTDYNNKTLNILVKGDDGVWNLNNLGSNIVMNNIFEVKYSKKHVLLKYFDSNFDSVIKLFKVDKNYNFLEVLDLTEDLYGVSINYLYDIVLTDYFISYVDYSNKSDLKIVSYFNDSYSNVWEETSNIIIDLDNGIDGLNSIYLTYFNEFLSVSYYDKDNKSVHNKFYNYSYSENFWFMQEEVITENVDLSCEISFIDYITYNLNSNSLDLGIDFGRNEDNKMIVKVLSFNQIDFLISNKFTILDRIDTNVYDASMTFSSFDNKRALMIEKNENTYDLNLYRLKKSSWEKIKTLFSDENIFLFKKAKYTDSFITYNLTSTTNEIVIHEPAIGKVTYVQTPQLSSNKVFISNNGERIFFITLEQDTMYIIEKNEEGNWLINELIEENINIIMNVKFSGNHLFLRYRDANFVIKHSLFKVNSDFSLSEELSIDENSFAILNKDYRRDVSLSDQIFAYISDTDLNSFEITTYKNVEGNWIQTGLIEVASANTYQYFFNRYLDTYQGNFVFNGLDLGSLVDNNLRTYVYKFNEESNTWKLKNENSFIVSGGFSSPLNPERISYNLNNNALDVCFLIDNDQGGLFKTKCFSRTNF